MGLRQYMQGFVIALAAVPALAADVDGKWKTTMDAGPQGTVELVFDLKAEGKKLTGTLSGPILPTPAVIIDGLIEGGDVSFSLRMSIVPGMPAVLVGYSGKLQGDELSLSAALDMGQGAMTIPVSATRIK